jgi:hypothetical protein
MVSLAHGAQTFTLKEGTTPFGPISVNQLHKVARFELDRPTNPAILVTGVLLFSTDGGKTTVPNWSCTFSGPGTLKDLGPVMGTSCQFPTGTTHVSGSLTVVGGSLTVSRVPLLGSK